MDLRFTDEQEAFRAKARGFLEESLTGDFAQLRGRGGPGDEHALHDERRAWERHLGASGWTCLGWPVEYGGHGLSFMEEVIWHEEYARARAPGRSGHIGEQLLGPTVLALGTDEQKRRFLPGIVRGDELWCQGYSEPNAGSDLANVQTRAVLEGDSWVLSGQKVWTSLAQWADWCFVLCRTDPASARHAGLSYLLVPMRQAGIEIRPIVQLTGTSEFSEVFFDGARAAKADVIGPVGGGWKVAMATLGFERGVSTLGQQAAFENELRVITEAARRNGKASDPLFRQRLAAAWMGLGVMRLHALRTFSASKEQVSRPASVSKLQWASWHRDLGELAMDVLGPEGELLEGAPYELTPMQRLFLFSRADTIYAGSNEIQRNIIAERALGLPREGGLGSAQSKVQHQAHSPQKQ
jgi:alkylation response protein AidB-like acyl-CoA dehydrogenase